ncbi:ATP-binding protein [Solimicrobium silvestre]|uniref:NACHT domain n=1 Tax=Solimicrobium silvestre TaxID=2099400 RepID=A0A2S9GYE8_9BURK|nr:ATP-binding protein [Solimicrobium silvestre]PRC92744.1 NACHT domain [Solimicrobium silvestre]
MTPTIKPTQLTRVGYTYQDYVCLKLLIEWFHNPEKYHWVSIEGASTEDGLWAIDDVVALDKNGKYTLLQVKFTIDSERNDLKLDFDWLLNHRPAGTSLLQKWSRDVKKYSDAGRIAFAALKTNRIPGDEFEKCLEYGKINIDKIPAEWLEKIIEQIGSYENAKSFFLEFTFDHSQQEIRDLHNHLYNQIVPDHATPEGWYRLLEAVECWATHKNEPSPDGQITLSHIYEILNSGIRESLPQFFEVPPGYSPPTGQFHAGMLQRTKLTGGWVISGLPGMGKSTYLSYLTTQLTIQKIPVIRHHYSISTQDFVDRTNYFNVARSLQHQLQLHYPKLFFARELDGNKLEDWLRTAADYSHSIGINLVLIIDGLDHVSRERKEISQLEHLINRLLPFKDRLCLIFGTQPIRDTDLPSRLIAEIPKNDRWLNLPAMDLSSIKCWLEALSDSNRIALNNYGGDKSGGLVEASEALLMASGGYPLHMTYSLQSLTLLGKTINKYEIGKLPPCPAGDIRLYYDALWSNLSEAARTILLLIACVDFPWPDKKSIGSCFENSLEFLESYSKIQHLVEKRRSGVFPFHSSIMVFLREQQGFKDLYTELLRKAKTWLEKDAPKYWQWGWKWIVEAHLGNTEFLTTGINREWLVDSFCNGYPLQHIEHIFSVAEQISSENKNYPELVRLRLLKIRLINGPEFQIQEYPQFMNCALSWNEEKYGMLWGADNLRTLDDKEISVISSLFREVDDAVCIDCFKEIIRRLEFYAKIGGGSENQKIDLLINAAIDVLCDRKNPSADEILAFLGRITEKIPLYPRVFDRLIETGNWHVILDFSVSKLPSEVVDLFWNYFVLACKIENVSIIERPERSSIASSVFGNIVLALIEPDGPPNPPPVACHS